MNTGNSIEPSGPLRTDSPDPKSELPAKKSGGAIAWLALLLALTAGGLGVVTYRDIATLKSDTSVSEQLVQRDNRISELQGKLESLGAMLLETRASLQGLEQAQLLNEQQLRGLTAGMSIDNSDLAVAEIEQLLIMAIHNLTLERDVDTALAALEAADKRIASLDEPQLSATRAQLTADINSLKAVNQVDTTGLSLYLADLLGRVSDLPLNQVPVVESVMVDIPEDATRPAWRRLLLAVWQEFRSMFVVTRTGSNAQATLLPDETYFLYQNLRLQLETARLAVIRQDTENLRTSLQLISSWLTDYFDTSDSSVANILQTTEKMAALELDPELPDISSSLETLHVYIKASGDGTGMQ